MIGTTDVSYEGDPDDANISDDEINYLNDCINQYFDKKISKDDVIWSYSGVRPLYGEEADNPSAISRDYHFINGTICWSATRHNKNNDP